MATRRKPSSFVPGVAATLSALTAGYWAPALGLPRLDLCLLNGNLLVPETTAASFAWTIGLGHSLFLGVLLAGSYRRWIAHRLPGGPATRGALWGLLVGMFSGLTVFPLLFGAGLFGLAWAPGMPVTLTLWFVTWGTVLGLYELEPRAE